MKEIFLPPELSREISEIYQALQEDYVQVADRIGLTCGKCSDNCCDSYFLHYTYCEWAYLWEGIRMLDDALLDRIMTRAQEYVARSRELLERDERPMLMCPLNEDGLCVLYSHRMLICRMHGIPATLTRPDGQLLRFPGCFRCQEIVGEKYESEADAGRCQMEWEMATAANPISNRGYTGENPITREPSPAAPTSRAT